MTDNSDDWDDDILDDSKIDPKELERINISSRDWTVETIVNQVKRGNFDLNPKFQRRNVWNDKRRSLLIESLIVNMPVPEIVLAENPKKKGSFIVIDGKQRLLSIVGFIEAQDSKFQFWDKPTLNDLPIRDDLNGLGFVDLFQNPKFEDDYRRLLNQVIRCTVLSNFDSEEDEALYIIFNRLNTSSVPLSTQELRQALNKGDFADYLITATNSKLPLHDVMGLEGPDDRLRDAEIILRFIAIAIFGKTYKSNLKDFLDTSMKKINKDWEIYRDRVEDLYKGFNSATELLCDTFGKDKVGRKFTEKAWEKRFNKVLFEAEVYYFIDLLNKKTSKGAREKFVKEFQVLCNKDRDFRDAIESSTKTVERYRVRFSRLRDLVKKSFKVRISDIPVPSEDI